MKCINIADLHFAMYSQDSIISTSKLPERLHYLNVTFRNICEYARTNEIDSINILGDLIHTKSMIHTDAMFVLLNIIRDYQDLWFNVIDGNHDMSSRSGTGNSALTGLDNEPNVNMIHKPTEINNIFYVPWNSSTMFETIKGGSKPFLISHFGLNEGSLNSGISIVSDISIDDLTQYEMVLLGHYHKPQEIQKNNTRVLYTGSIIQMDFGERNDEKRFIVWNTENGLIESVPTEGYKKYYALELTSNNVQDILNEAKKLEKEGHFVRVDMLEKVDTTDFKDIRIVDKVNKDITNRGISRTMTEDDKLNRYLEINEIPLEERNLYIQVAKEIVSRCGE